MYCLLLVCFLYMGDLLSKKCQRFASVEIFLVNIVMKELLSSAKAKCKTK